MACANTNAREHQTSQCSSFWRKDNHAQAQNCDRQQPKENRKYTHSHSSKSVEAETHGKKETARMGGSVDVNLRPNLLLDGFSSDVAKCVCARE